MKINLTTDNNQNILPTTVNFNLVLIKTPIQATQGTVPEANISQ
jgi:hypothetical protein